MRSWGKTGRPSRKLTVNGERRTATPVPYSPFPVPDSLSTDPVLPPPSVHQLLRLLRHLHHRRVPFLPGGVDAEPAAVVGAGADEALFLGDDVATWIEPGEDPPNHRS